MKTKIPVAIMFGGVSPEHEVSIITGLQVIENIDREAFQIIPIYQDQKGIFWYYKNLTNRRDFKKIKPQKVLFGADSKGGYIKSEAIVASKIYIEVAYLSFHGGYGESGPIQGMLQVFGIPFTSSSVESSSIAMNKALTKEVLEANGIPTISWVRIFSSDIKKDLNDSIKNIAKKLDLPVIVKPVHMGSSIGAGIAKTQVELKKILLECAQIDGEVIIEKFIEKFKEYNCSVRLIDGVLQSSEVEEPISHDEILSFADKYKSGGKKSGEGMASLVRRLPAQIPAELSQEIRELAKKIYILTRSKGMVRIDFMYANQKLYPIEINPIPGSMSYYLWEATGISFTQQITDLVNQAIEDYNINSSYLISHKSDIVDTFIASSKDR